MDKVVTNALINYCTCGAAKRFMENISNDTFNHLMHSSKNYA